MGVLKYTFVVGSYNHRGELVVANKIVLMRWSNQSRLVSLFASVLNCCKCVADQTRQMLRHLFMGDNKVVYGGRKCVFVVMLSVVVIIQHPRHQLESTVNINKANYINQNQSISRQGAINDQGCVLSTFARAGTGLEINKIWNESNFWKDSSLSPTWYFCGMCR